MGMGTGLLLSIHRQGIPAIIHLGRLLRPRLLNFEWSDWCVAGLKISATDSLQDNAWDEILNGAISLDTDSHQMRSRFKMVLQDRQSTLRTLEWSVRDFLFLTKHSKGFCMAFALLSAPWRIWGKAWLFGAIGLCSNDQLGQKSKACFIGILAIRICPARDGYQRGFTWKADFALLCAYQNSEILGSPEFVGP